MMKIRGHNHTWNETDEWIIDLTASQFSGTYPQVNIIKKDSIEASKHYLASVCYMH